MNLIDRAPPSDLDAELALIGSVLVDPRVMRKAQHITAEDFYGDANRILWSVLRRMHANHVAIDSTTLIDELRSAGKFEAVGGGAYLGRCINSVPHAAHALYYAGIVREKSIARQLIFAATETIRTAYAESSPAEDQIHAAAAAIASVARRGVGSDNRPRPVEEVAREVYDALDAARTTPATRGVLTGLYDLDEQMGPILGGEMLVVAARPGAGKTAFALQVAEHQARQDRGAVLFVSLEMRDRTLIERRMCGLAGLDAKAIRRGYVTDDDMNRLGGVLFEYKDVPLHVWSGRRATVDKIQMMAEAMIGDGQPLASVIVDYLQIVQPDNHRAEERSQLVQITRDLAAMSVELALPVILLAQLDREADDVVPSLRHLAGSAEIEKAAAQVVMLWKRPPGGPRSKEPDDPDDMVRVLLRKNRFGHQGQIKLRFNGAATTFENYCVPIQSLPNYSPELAEQDF